MNENNVSEMLNEMGGTILQFNLLARWLEEAPCPLLTCVSDELKEYIEKLKKIHKELKETEGRLEK